MSTRRAERGGSIRLILAGELDLAARSHLAPAVDAAQDDASRVILDLGALTFIDSSGIAILFAAGTRARRQGAVLMLLDPRGQVRRLLDLVGIPPGAGLLDRTDRPQERPAVAA